MIALARRAVHTGVRNGPARWIAVLALVAVSLVPAGAAETNATTVSAPSTSQQTPPAAAGHRSAEPSYPRLVWDDTRLVLTAPARWDSGDWLGFSAGSLAVVGAALLLDRPVAEHVDKHQNDALDRDLKVVEPFGAEYSYAVLGAFYAAGAVTHDSNAKQVTGDGLAASLIASGIITPCLKTAVGRSRPHDDKGTHDFHPFTGDASFPSGHATQAFAVGSVIAAHYDSPWVTAVSYGTASLVGAARVDHRAHFVSDVLAGALIGTSVGRAVVHINGRERSAVALEPVVDAEFCGVQARVAF